MISIIKKSEGKPYQLFYELYEKALNAKQTSVEAVAISSFNNIDKFVDSRFVNLKFLIDEDWVFFSNYSSPKSIAFDSYNQISALIYWQSINTQIRIKANISKTSVDFNQQYFSNRSREKNALAISSNQSNPVISYDKVIENYDTSLKNDDLTKCPKYWGGYSFIPYEIEFWEGNKYRLNKRNLYKKEENRWNHLILEP